MIGFRLPSIDHMAVNTHAYDLAVRIVPFFYYAVFFIAFRDLEGLDHLVLQGGPRFAPRWPIFWASQTSYEVAVTAILIAFTLTSLLGGFFARHRIARILAALGMFEYHAFRSSFGGPNHQWDLLLWVSLIFIFLPSTRGDRAEADPEAKKKFLAVFWCAQAFILLTYSMSGIGKLYGAAFQVAAGETSAFSPYAAALHTASVLSAKGQVTPLGPFLLTYPYAGWFPFLFILYVETFSFVAAFRPSLHRVWGLLLVLFHIGTLLTMRAVFVAPALLALIFFASSPFAPKTSPREVIRSFPLVPSLVRLYTWMKRGLTHNVV